MLDTLPEFDCDALPPFYGAAEVAAARGQRIAGRPHLMRDRGLHAHRNTALSGRGVSKRYGSFLGGPGPAGNCVLRFFCEFR